MVLGGVYGCMIGIYPLGKVPFTQWQKGVDELVSCNRTLQVSYPSMLSSHKSTSMAALD